jgi:hypothetical protein
MATTRLPMRHLREVLRQKLDLKRSHREVARSVGVSNGSVAGAVSRAKTVGLDWPQIRIPCAKTRTRPGRSRDALSRAWTRRCNQFGGGCCSAGGGTVTDPRASSSSHSGMRRRVALQYLGASSRYRLGGQYGMTRMMSVR